MSTPHAAPLTHDNHSEIGFASAVWARLVLATPAKARLVSARKERFRCRGRDFRTGQDRAYRARARPFVRPHSRRAEIGRASCRERVCQYVSISVGAV